MTREELEHIIRASGDVTHQYEFVIVGSQSMLVVATGGGAVLRPENRAALKEGGIVVYLHATPRLLFERTRLDHNRPLLQVADPMKKIEELFAVRDPLYREWLENPLFETIARSLIEDEIVLYRAVLFSKKNQGGTYLPWHQDGGKFWGLSRDPYL